MDDPTEVFEAHRPRLFGIAYRMLGSRADAEDILQDCYLRWPRSQSAAIRSPEAWLITIATRLCLDRLRAAKKERESYVGPWLPEPLVGATLPSPELQLEMANEVSVAFLAVLERLAPEERAAFLLHEVFDYDYPEIAGILGKAEPACRQLVHRARVHLLAGRPRFVMAAHARERLLEKFIVAVGSGDRQAVMELLSEDARYVFDGGGKVVAALKCLDGADRIARLFYRIARNYLGLRYRLIRVNGELGAVGIFDDQLFSILAFETDDGLAPLH